MLTLLLFSRPVIVIALPLLLLLLTCCCTCFFCLLVPQGLPVELSDFSPMRVAFEDRDTGFMAIPLVENHMWQIW